MSRDAARRLHLTPLDDERVIAALPIVTGRLLDVGCGSNLLVRSYGNGVGVDVVPWVWSDLVVENSAHLPFDDHEFDTVSFLACLNHISNREESLREARRVLRDGGRLVVTMVGPRIGQIVHSLRRRHDPDGRVRHIDDAHEFLGMSDEAVRTCLTIAGFRVVHHRRFVFGLNNLYVAEKAVGGSNE